MIVLIWSLVLWTWSANSFEVRFLPIETHAHLQGFWWLYSAAGLLLSHVFGLALIAFDRKASILSKILWLAFCFFFSWVAMALYWALFVGGVFRSLAAFFRPETAK